MALLWKKTKANRLSHKQLPHLALSPRMRDSLALLPIVFISSNVHYAKSLKAGQSRILPMFANISPFFSMYMVLKIFSAIDVVYLEAVKLFYTYLSIVDADEPVIQSSVLGNQIEFNLKHLY